MEKIRCKLNVNALRDVGSAIRVEMGAIYSTRPDDPNKSFSTSTPCAFFSMDISKEAPASRAPWLTPGAILNVDLSLAEIPEWNWYPDRLPEENRKIELRLNDLDSTPLFGTFVRKTDTDFFERNGNKMMYPVLVEENGERKLYDNVSNWLRYFWKYVE